MTTLDDLKREAAQAASFRGHALGPWQDYQERASDTACVLCGKWAHVRSNPAPNDTYVSGEAVALGCLELEGPDHERVIGVVRQGRRYFVTVRDGDTVYTASGHAEAETARAKAEALAAHATYNGYSNWHTWLVLVYVDNYEDVYETMQGTLKRMAKRRAKWATGTARTWAARNVTGMIRRKEGGEFRASLVIWAEVAEAWNSDLEEYKRYN
jgi:hypothetical protein